MCKIININRQDFQKLFGAYRYTVGLRGSPKTQSIYWLASLSNNISERAVSSNFTCLGKTHIHMYRCIHTHIRIIYTYTHIYTLSVTKQNNENPLEHKACREVGPHLGSIRGSVTSIPQPQRHPDTLTEEDANTESLLKFRLPSRHACFLEKVREAQRVLGAREEDRQAVPGEERKG